MNIKRLVLSLTFALVAGTAFAQIPGYPNGCKDCVVYSYVDNAPDGATVEAATMAFEGWGFECNSGQASTHVDVWYQDYDGLYRPLKQAEWTLTTGVARPDVRDHYLPYCANVTAYSGWRLVLANPPPAGLRRMVINVWRGPLFEGHQRLYLVK